MDHKKITDIETEKLTEAIESVLGAITNFLGIELEYDYSIENYEREDGEEREIIKLNISGNHDSLLIGYHGKTMSSIQDLVATGISTKLEVLARVGLDVSDYRAQRVESLENLARRAEGEVLDSGQPLAMEPMDSADRRIIHKVITENGLVDTESEGSGQNRHVVVKPKTA